MRQLRVAMVHGAADPTRDGVADYLYRLIGALSGVQVEVTPVAVTPRTRPGKPWEAADWWRAAWRAGTAIRRLRPDLVHVQFAPSAYRFTGAAGLLPLVIGRDLPLVTTLHEYGRPGGLDWWERLTGWDRDSGRLIRASNAIVVTNGAHATDVLSATGRTPVLVPIAPNVADHAGDGFVIRPARERTRAGPSPAERSPGEASRGERSPGERSPGEVEVAGSPGTERRTGNDGPNGALHPSGQKANGATIRVSVSAAGDPGGATPDGHLVEDAVRARLGVPPHARLLAFFGFVHPVKGLRYLLSALPELRRRHPDLHLVVIGGFTSQALPRAQAEDFQAELAALAARQGVAHAVTFTGYLPPATVSAALHICEAAVLPFTEGVTTKSGALLTALTHRLPTAITVPDHPDPDLIDADTVAVIPARRDVAALTTTVDRLLADTDLRRRLSAGGQRLAARRNWSTVAEAHRALYDDLLDAR